MSLKFAIRVGACVAVSSLALAAGTAWAQEAGASDEAIIVTGTRASLEGAEDFKRDSDVLVDGISADDIGALPDESIADSLVRIPGLTANDSEDGFGEVSVRGLGPDLANTMYNGRILPSTRFDNRRLNLGDLPTEGIARAFVQKTASAATIEGGLGGTIGLQSVRPLETRRRGLSLVLRGMTDDVAQDIKGVYGFKPYGYRGEVSYVGQLADNLGIAFSYAHIQQTNARPNVQLDAYQSRAREGDVDGDGFNELVPQNAGITLGASNQRRDSILGMIQWEPSDSLMVSLDGYYIDSGGSNTPIRYVAAGLNAVARDATTYETTDSVVTRYDGYANLHRAIVNDNRVGTKQYQGGLNLRYDDGGPFAVSFDLYFAQARQSGLNRSATLTSDATNPAQNAAGQIRPVAYDASDPKNILIDFYNPAADDFALVSLDTSRQNLKDTMKAARLDFQYDRPFAIFGSMEFGVRAEARTKRNRPDGDTYSFGPLASHPDVDDSYLVDQADPLANVADYMGGVGAVTFPLFDIDKLWAFQDDPGAVFNSQPVNDVTGNSTITENTMALYYQGNIDLGSRLRGNVGVRYFVTDETVEGFATKNAAPGEPTSPITPLKVKHSYDYLLPSLNLRYGITRSLIVRGALSKTLSRPPFNRMRIGSAVDYTDLVEGSVISRGNPDLKPYSSKNADLSLEWYPNRNMTFAIQGFYKDVNNFIRNEAVESLITLPNGSVIPVTINTSVNDPEKRKFYGFEIVVRRDFNFLPGFLRHLGVRADYSRNWTDAVGIFNSADGERIELKPNNFTPWIANVQLYYSRRNLDLRLAYRYYAAYSREDSNAYQRRPGGTLDLTGGLTLKRGIRVIGSIRNLTKTKIYSNFLDYRYPDNFGMARNVIYPGRQFTVGLRAKF